MYDENFLGIIYMGFVLMVGNLNMIMFVPLILQALLESAQYFKGQIERAGPDSYMKKLKEPVNQCFAYRKEIAEIKADIEVYIGLYLIIVWFFGWSHIVCIVMYLQFLRLRYMLSHPT